MKRLFVILPLLAFLLTGCPSPDTNGTGSNSSSDQSGTPGPTFKDDSEATIDTSPEITEEATPDPAVEATIEPSVEPSSEVTDMSTPDNTEEVTIEPTIEPSPEVTAEPTDEITPIPTQAPTEIPTPVPTPILIDDFNSYIIGQPPGGNWISGCNTSFIPVPPEAANTGVIVNKKINDRIYLSLMNDIFGRRDTFGKGCTGYSYAQLEFDAPAKGMVFFEYYHVGWNPGPDPGDPGFKLEFFKNLPTADIGNQTITSDWSGSTSTLDFSTIGIAIPDTGVYNLTWRVLKNESSIDLVEDDIYIDNITFEYD